jgi:hypothetical protein
MRSPSVKGSIELARSLGRGENPFTDAYTWDQAQQRGFVRWNPELRAFVLAEDWRERVALYSRKRRR